ISTGEKTLDSTAVATGVAVRFELVGGPEDGRTILPRSGDAIGRAGGDAQIALYADSRLTDRRLSRSHLRWDGARFQASRPIQVIAADGPRDPAAPPRVGDVLVVTTATRLRAVSGD
ncbi:MAG: hypothetical protein ABMB14_38965, partial [Myxococcota bacterium]